MVQRCSTDRCTQRERAQKSGVKVGQLLIVAAHSMGTNPLSGGAESKPILPICGLNQFLAAQQWKFAKSLAAARLLDGQPMATPGHLHAGGFLR